MAQTIASLHEKFGHRKCPDCKTWQISTRSWACWKPPLSLLRCAFMNSGRQATPQACTIIVWLGDFVHIHWAIQTHKHAFLLDRHALLSNQAHLGCARAMFCSMGKCPDIGYLLQAHLQAWGRGPCICRLMMLVFHCGHPSRAFTGTELSKSCISFGKVFDISGRHHTLYPVFDIVNIRIHPYLLLSIWLIWFCNSSLVTFIYNSRRKR